MRMIMIAGIYNGETRVGFRILDADSVNNGVGQVIDAPDDKVYAVLSSNKIENLEVKNKKLKGSNGDISRFGRIIDGRQEVGVQSPLVIISQVGDVGYIVSDSMGKVKQMRTEDLIRLLSSHKLANGKLMNRDGTAYISTISGQYHYIPYKPSITAQPAVKTEAKQSVARPSEVRTEARQSEAKNSEVKPEIKQPAAIQKEYQFSLSDEQIYILRTYYSNLDIPEDKKNAEIEHINKIVQANEESKEHRKTKLLNEVIARVSTGIKLSSIFGNELATTIAQFISTNMPLPASLVHSCHSYIQSSGGAQQFYCRLFPEFEDSINGIFKADADTLRVAAQDYLKHTTDVDILGEYGAMKTQTDIDIADRAAKYALVKEVSLTEIRALIGTINMLDEYGSTLVNSVGSNYSFRNKIGMIHFAAMDYNGKLKGPNRKICEAIQNITTYTPELGEAKYDIPLYYTTEYLAVPRFLDKPICREHPNCTFYSTPTTYTKSIRDVYAGLLVLMRYDEERAINEFLLKALDFIRDRENLQREESRKATEELARRSIAKQQELRRRREGSRLGSQPTSGISKSTTAESEHDAQYKAPDKQAEAKHDSGYKMSEAGQPDTQPIQSDVHKSSEQSVITPESQKMINSGKTQLQIDLEAGADLSKYDPIDLYNELKKHMTGKMDALCYTISEDMIARGLKYRQMTSRQRFRINEAINKMMQEVYGRNQATNKPKQLDTTENKKYQLAEHPDIKSKIDRLIKNANSVEMTAVLSQEPNVLKICYSILKYNTASDRQLARVDNAIQILDEQ